MASKAISRMDQNLESTLVPAAGRLVAACGPMFAGKTTTLLREWDLVQAAPARRALAIKPACDRRYAEDQIVTHDGRRIPALAVEALPDLAAGVTDLFVDEAHFMGPPFIQGSLPLWVHGLLRRGVNVVCAGLDMDWRGRAFPIMAEILGMADEVIKLRALCDRCGAPAAHYLKLDPTSQRLVGGREAYAARCRAHWRYAPGLAIDWARPAQ